MTASDPAAARLAAVAARGEVDDSKIDLHAVTLIRDVAEIDGKVALTVWHALQPLIGHLQREAVVAARGDTADAEAVERAPESGGHVWPCPLFYVGNRDYPGNAPCTCRAALSPEARP